MEWVNLSDKKPDQLEVRILLNDGSEINFWAQSDGDFYYRALDVFIDSWRVTHWKYQNNCNNPA